MIELSLNGEQRRLPQRCSIADALQQWGYRQTQIAVAVNDQFIPRSGYAQQWLNQGDRVDIVSPVQGG